VNNRYSSIKEQNEEEDQQVNVNKEFESLDACKNRLEMSTVKEKCYKS